MKTHRERTYTAEDLSPAMRRLLRRMARAETSGFVLLNVHQGTLGALRRRGLMDGHRLTRAGWDVVAGDSEARPELRETASLMATGSFALRQQV